MSSKILLIDSDHTLDELGELVRSILNVSDSNYSKHIAIQRRENVSKGGWYYIFEFMYLQLELRNMQKDFLEEHSDLYPYFLYLKRGKFAVEDKLMNLLMNYLSKILSDAGIKTSDAAMNYLTPR